MGPKRSGSKWGRGKEHGDDPPCETPGGKVANFKKAERQKKYRGLIKELAIVATVGFFTVLIGVSIFEAGNFDSLKEYLRIGVLENTTRIAILLGLSVVSLLYFISNRRNRHSRSANDKFGWVAVMAVLIFILVFWQDSGPKELSPDYSVIHYTPVILP